jgi:ABC-type lipoprotein release transport system permease subunit
LLTVLLFDVSPRDPFIFTTIVIVLTATVSLACFIPARRATRVAPLEALRFD